MNLRDPACPACNFVPVLFCLAIRHVRDVNKHVCTHFFLPRHSLLSHSDSHSRPFPIIDNSVMGPKPKNKPKPNTRSGVTHTRPVSRKRQASNADELPSKRTRHTNKKPDDDDDEEPEQEEDEEAHEEEKEVEEDDVVDPPPSRSGKRGHGIKVGPPPRYVGHDRWRSPSIVPFFYTFFPLFEYLRPFLQENRPRSSSR